MKRVFEGESQEGRRGTVYRKAKFRIEEEMSFVLHFTILIVL